MADPLLKSIIVWVPDTLEGRMNASIQKLVVPRPRSASVGTLR